MAINSHIEREAYTHCVDHALLELVKVSASQVNGCGYYTDLHARNALERGVPQRVLNVVAVWAETELFSPKERAASRGERAGDRAGSAQYRLPDGTTVAVGGPAALAGPEAVVAALEAALELARQELGRGQAA